MFEFGWCWVYLLIKIETITFLNIVFCGVDIATMVTANHVAEPYLPLFSSPFVIKVLPQNTFVCHGALYTLKKIISLFAF